MRNVIATLMASLVVACSTAPVTPTLAADVPVQFLLNSAASDFHAHGPRPERFRDVHIGHVTNPDGTKSYRMCGEFLPANGPAEWTPFATIKTSGYEQYLGGGATSWCQGMTRDGDEDYSGALQDRYIAPK